MPNEFFKTGKLPPKLISKLLKHFQNPPKDANVKIIPTFGQDTGVFQIDRSFIVVKTNPVTFATDDIGYYSVILNANDVALSGAIPKWFSCTILLPENKTDEVLCEKIFQSIADECNKLQIAVVAGHTEVTYGIDRPIVNGTMLGYLPQDRKIISTFGGQPNDDLLLINPVGIEGTAIIARERAQTLLEHDITIDEINKGKSYLYNPGISIIEAAQELIENFDIHALHGPTEGGIAMGLVEMAKNSHCGLEINRKEVIIHRLTRIFSEIFNIDPFGLISSGCLIAAVNPTDTPRILQFFKRKNRDISKIGKLNKNMGNYVMWEESGKKNALKFSHIDEITKIFRN